MADKETILQGNAQETPGEVSPLPSPGATRSDREDRIAGIVDRIERLKGTDNAETIIDDERKNLESFLAETSNKELKNKISAILK